jgi:hypothetical protein
MNAVLYGFFLFARFQCADMPTLKTRGRVQQPMTSRSTARAEALEARIQGRAKTGCVSLRHLSIGCEIEATILDAETSLNLKRISSTQVAATSM